MYKIIYHITTAHPRDDIRIFHKECKSLKKAGYTVCLVVADGRGDELVDDIQVFDVGKPKSRNHRFFKTGKLIYKLLLHKKPSLIHFHDPEFLFYAKKLRNKGFSVIYDVHEDVSKQLLNKPYLPKTIAKFISVFFMQYEQRLSKHFSAIVASTPIIASKFQKLNKNTIDVCNYPIPDESVELANLYGNSNNICYVGGIAKVRGLKEMIESVNLTESDVTLHLAGNIIDSDLSLFDKLQKEHDFSNIRLHGFLNRKNVFDIIRNSRIGLVLLHPLPNYVESLPIKLFEYLLAGVPVIASDFPLFRSIVEDNKCGICVNPLNTKAIADAIDTLLQNVEMLKQMGENGRQLVLSKYNWNIEEKKLLNLYSNILEIN